MASYTSYSKPLNLGEFDETDGPGTYIELRRLAQAHGRTPEEFLRFAKSGELRLSVNVNDVQFKPMRDVSPEEQAQLEWLKGPRGDFMIYLNKGHINELIKNESLSLESGWCAKLVEETDVQLKYKTYPVAFVDDVKVRISQINCLAEDYSEFRKRLETLKSAKAEEKGAMQAVSRTESKLKTQPTASSESAGYENQSDQDAPYIKQLRRKNYGYECIVDHFRAFYKKHGSVPTAGQLWNELVNAPQKEWELDQFLINGEMVVDISGIKLRKVNFNKRYKEYFVK